MTPELTARIKEARAIAEDQLGMSPGEVRFVAVPAHIIYATGATGLPGLWAHWSEGRDYWISKKGHDAGMSRIYELVVNTRPHLALLHDANPEIVNVMVAAHVFGHTHLDLHNVCFRDTNPHMLETVATWAKRIAAYEEEHGDIVVEQFIDRVLSLEPFADPGYKGKVFKDEKREMPPFPDLMPAPPPSKPKRLFQPNRDLHGFIAQYAEHLEGWQRDILEIYRQRTIFFNPMRRTKVLHEGFAALAHRRIMEKLNVSDAEWIDYSQINSGVMSPHPGSLNPYWLGHAILEAYEKEHGWPALLEMVALEDDASLIRNHLTEKLVDDLDLFSFRFHPSEKVWKADENPKDWEVIRDSIARKFDTLRAPVIEITGYDHDGKRGLYLTHRFDGRRLDMPYAEAALVAISDLWGQRVHLRTTLTKGDVEGTAWAPNERDTPPKGKETPVDWEYLGTGG